MGSPKCAKFKPPLGHSCCGAHVRSYINISFIFTSLDSPWLRRFKGPSYVFMSAPRRLAAPGPEAPVVQSRNGGRARTVTVTYTTADEDGAETTTELVEVKKERVNFPETWIWKDIQLE